MNAPHPPVNPIRVAVYVLLGLLALAALLAVIR